MKLVLLFYGLLPILHSNTTKPRQWYSFDSVIKCLLPNGKIESSAQFPECHRMHKTAKKSLLLPCLCRDAKEHAHSSFNLIPIQNFRRGCKKMIISLYTLFDLPCCFQWFRQSTTSRSSQVNVN